MAKCKRKIKKANHGKRPTCGKLHRRALKKAKGLRI